MRAIELSPEGTGYRTKTRFARFYNLPELMSMFREAADVQTADMLNLPVPKLKSGAVQNIAVPPTDIQREMVQGLAERRDALLWFFYDLSSLTGHTILPVSHKASDIVHCSASMFRVYRLHQFSLWKKQ